MNDKRRPAWNAAAEPLALTISDAAEVLLREIDREEALGHDPATSRLWTRAPWGLRREYADARCDRETFWLRLRVWLEFQRRSAA